MPPRPKYTRDEIITAAFELAREEGIDNVAARAVGKRLNTSASPIFTVFGSMEELKEEVFEKARLLCSDYMEGLFDYTPAFKEFGLRWIRFAAEEPHLYRLLFFHGRSIAEQDGFFPDAFRELREPLTAEIRTTFGIGAEEAGQLLRQMLIYSNGMAALSMNGDMAFTQEEISASISRVCIGLAIGAQLRDGSFSEPQARAMAEAANAGMTPRKKDLE